MKVDEPNKLPKVECRWARVEKLAYKLSWDASRAYGIPFEECLEESYYQFMMTMKYWKPEHGTKFSSYFAMIYKLQMKSRIKERMQRKERLPEVRLKESMVRTLVAPGMDRTCLSMVEELSEDARQLVHLLLETPEELLEGIRTPKRLLGRVKAYMREEFGFSQQRLRDIHSEVETKFREALRTM